MTIEKPSTVGSVSVRLIRADKAIDAALRSEHKFREVPSETGRLFVGQSPSNPPPWASFVKEVAGTGAEFELQNRSCGAVLFLTVQRAAGRDRVFAFTFGTGHLALDPDMIERGFGLKVTLNKVERSKLRTLDVASLDATVIQRRTQASRDIDIDEFGVNKHQDLLRLAAGTPNDADLARTLSGRDSLTLNRRYSASELPALCDRLLALSESKEYQTHYKFIDNVKPVQDRQLLSELDGLVTAARKRTTLVTTTTYMPSQRKIRELFKATPHTSEGCPPPSVQRAHPRKKVSQEMSPKWDKPPVHARGLPCRWRPRVRPLNSFELAPGHCERRERLIWSAATRNSSIKSPQ